MRDAGPCAQGEQPPQVKSTCLKKEILMKRFHVHVAVKDLAAPRQFYSTLFARAPSVQRGLREMDALTIRA